MNNDTESLNIGGSATDADRAASNPLPLFVEEPGTLFDTTEPEPVAPTGWAGMPAPAGNHDFINWQIVGSYSGRNGCYYCGTGIANIIVIEHRPTGAVSLIGSTCAEKVGWSKATIAEMARERYSRTDEGKRDKAARAARAAACAAYEDAEAAHNAKAPTLPRFISATEVLYDLDSDTLATPLLKRTRYGLAWLIEHDDAAAEWVTAFPARLSTMAKKGYREGWAVTTEFGDVVVELLPDADQDAADERAEVLAAESAAAWDAWSAARPKRADFGK